MSDLPAISRSVNYRGCPSCGHIFAQWVIEQMRFDLPCPGCGRRMISDFIPLADMTTVAATRTRKPTEIVP